jgi:hypothetical protein
VPAPSVPLRLIDSGGGVLRPLVTVSVGGGPPVPVLLDTGSYGLRILADAIGPGTDDPPRAGPTRTVHYGAGPFEVRTVDAVVSLGDGPGAPATAEPVSVDAIDPSLDRAETRLAGDGIRGILGISPDAAEDDVLSPLVQLPGPPGHGFSITLPDRPGGPPGALVLGPPPVPPGAVVIPMHRQRLTYPDGRPGWARDVDLCWSVAGARGCGATNLDTGAKQSVLPPGPGHPGGALAPGSAVALSTPDGTPVWSYPSAPSPITAQPVYRRLFRPTRYSTGIGIYLSHTVAWDLDTGHLLVSPKPPS